VPAGCQGFGSHAQILVQNVVKKTLCSCAKSRKQRVGIFAAFYIYGSKAVIGKILKTLELLTTFVPFGIPVMLDQGLAFARSA
jgi:hypothetical protein